MKEVKILSYVAQPYGDYQLGFCRVDIAGRSQMTLKVMKNKEGNPYCAFMSAKVADAWVPCMTFANEEQHKKFFAACNLQLKPFLIPPPQKEPEQNNFMPDQEEDQLLPF